MAPPNEDDDFDSMWTAATSGSGGTVPPDASSAPGADDDFDAQWTAATSGGGGNALGIPSSGGRIIPRENPNTFSNFAGRLISDLNPIPMLALGGQLAWENTNPVRAAVALARGEEPFPTTKALARSEIDRIGGAAKRAGRDISGGHYGDAIAHGLGVVPLVGPMISENYDKLAEGNFAEPAADALAFLGPKKLLSGTKILGKKVPGLPERAANILRRRAVARSLDLMMPGEKTGPSIRASLRAHPEMIEQLGAGNAEELAQRALGVQDALGKKIEGLVQDTTPVDVSMIQEAADKVRQKGKKYVTTLLRDEEYDTGLKDQFGNAIMGIRQVPIETSQFPAHQTAHARSANMAERLAAQFADEETGQGAVPFGEVVKARMGAGRASKPAQQPIAGTVASPTPESAKVRASAFRDVLHDPQFAHLGAAELDAAYSRWKDVATALRRADASAIGKKGSAGVEMLKGRVAAKLAATLASGGAGAALGFGAGGPVGGALGVMTGAAVGNTLANSAFWGSLRATTYARMARLAAEGKDSAAMRLMWQEAVAYNQMKDAEKRQAARKALETAGREVVGP